VIKSQKVVEIFTDGACKGNPGPGGWGALLRWGKYTRELQGFADQTTNNIMELTAVIQALQALKEPCQVTLTTDSTYVKNGITQWIDKWKQNGWRTAGKKPVKNRQLWENLDQEVQRHSITWKWVKGHAGHPENERADELANEAIRKQQQG